MPSIAMHLAAANEYLKKHSDENAVDFLAGSIAPDCVPLHEKTHHSTSHYKESDGLTYLVGKVNLNDCMSDFDFNTSYGRGYFFHLFMDYEFYHNILGADEEKFKKMPYKKLSKRLRYDYDVIGFAIKTKYNVVFTEIVAKYDVNVSGEPVLLSEEKCCEFIEQIASIDLMSEYRKYSNSQN